MVIYFHSEKIAKTENELRYSLIKKQIDTMETLTFGLSINVLLISDRLYGCAKGLKEYLQNSTDITAEYVDLVKASSDDAIKLITEKPFDFLIIVGHLQDDSKYSIVKHFQSVNKYSCVAFYALYTALILNLSKTYGIDDLYDREKPLDELLASMRRTYDMKQFRKEEAQKGINGDEQEQPKQPTGFLALLRRFFLR